MTLIRELIDIPDHVAEGDFVLKLTQGVTPAQAAATVDNYVVTPQLAEAFADALKLIAGAVQDGTSKADYLHGSFGSGKSHFMAVLHLLLQGDPHARAVPELHPALEATDAALKGKKFLLVPLHFLTAKSMDATILGGYVEHVQAVEPGAPLPAVFLGDQILVEELPGMRARLGDDAFIAGLNEVAAGGDDWGEFGSSWDQDRLDQALAADATDPLRQELGAAYIAAFRPATPAEARTTGEGFINLDDGLAAVSQHAQSLGYDAVIFFLDELILWLASSIGNLDFVQQESQKLTKLVEGTNANLPVPLVSFVARQRDLRELVGDHVIGAEQRSFADNLELQKGRFGKITLEDRNLPVIAHRRLLEPVDDDAATTLRRAVDEALAGRDEVLRALLTSDADLDLFRLVYPFSPALVQALVAVSEALQRERTALKVMAQLLVDQRDTLALGQLIPVGDLWDVVAARDEPFSSDLRQAFETAKKLYRTKLRPMLLDQHGLDDTVPADDPRWVPFAGDDRILKTILLAGLVERVEAFRNLDAARLVALNWGSVTSPIPGHETQILTDKLRTWMSRVGELKVGDDPVNPTVSIALVDVDTDDIIKTAIETFDNAGARRRALRAFVDDLLGSRLGEDLSSTTKLVWRGWEREVDVTFGNIRDAVEVPDASLRASGDRPKVVVDFPFDDQGRGPEDDLERIDRFLEANEPTTTICWIPSFLNNAGLRDLQTFVALDELLKGDRWAQHTSRLSDTQRQQARPILENLRSQLQAQLRQTVLVAYGVRGGDDPRLDRAHSLTDHFRSLDPSLVVRPTTAPDMAGAFDELCDQAYASRYPDHPRFEDRVTPAQLRTTWAEVQRAVGDPDGRITVEQRNRAALRNVANALGLGTMHESHFVLEPTWRLRLDRHLAKAGDDGTALTVADLRVLINDGDHGDRGLAPVVADLVILTVAAQTDHSVVQHGAAVASDGGTALPREAILRREALPSAEDWATATDRAARLFGVTVSPMVSAAELARFGDEVTTRATALVSGANELTAALGTYLAKVGLDSSVDRARVAAAAAELVAALRPGDPGAVVTALCRARIEVSAEAMGRTLTSAPEVVRALGETNWALLLAAGDEIGDQLRSVLRHDELAESFDGVRRRLEREATDKVVKPEPPPPPPPTDPQRQAVVHSAGELDAVIGKLRAEVGERPIEITWRPLGDR